MVGLKSSTCQKMPQSERPAGCEYQPDQVPLPFLLPSEIGLPFFARLARSHAAFDILFSNHVLFASFVCLDPVEKRPYHVFGIFYMNGARSADGKKHLSGYVDGRLFFQADALQTAIPG